MGSAVFAGLSAAFFTVYLLFAQAMGIITGSTITPISAPEDPATRGGFNGFIDGVIQVFTYGFNLMANFFELLTFQVPGQENAAIISLLIFTPLGFINAWNIFKAIRS